MGALAIALSRSVIAARAWIHGRGQHETRRKGQRHGGAGSLCGLGKTAPNPILTTLRYFRDEYEAHLEGRCPAGKCTALIKYRVLDNCTCCTICAMLVAGAPPA